MPCLRHRLAWMLVVALAWVTAATPAYAAFPGANGRLVFQYEAPVPGEGLTQNDLYSVMPDGSGLVQLTATDFRNEFGPAWSADGDRIVFWRAKAPFGPGSVWTMAADGTGQRRLTRNIDARDPAWSPNGTRIVFTRFTGVGSTDLFTIRASDGGDRRHLTFGPGIDFEPAWSPDGRLVVFTRGFEEGDVGDLYVLDRQTDEVSQLTSSPAYDHQAGWSPEGDRIVFERDFDTRFSIFVIDADGSNLQRLTSGPFFDIGPAFSPSGNRIAFGSDRGGFFHDLFVMRADGTDRRRVVHDEFAAGFPDWQPLHTLRV